LFIVLVGGSILLLNIFKYESDRKLEEHNKKMNSDNVAKIDSLLGTVQHQSSDLFIIKSALDSIGLRVNLPTGKVIINDLNKFQKIVLSNNGHQNVTSINQKGGQTAFDITNN
ncbi:MAG: hypothetical protein KAF41_05785, partial [Flavobacterium sp.]|nr:hypothetical protein [Flavobacterium sp.]